VAGTSPAPLDASGCCVKGDKTSSGCPVGYKANNNPVDGVVNSEMLGIDF